MIRVELFGLLTDIISL